MYNLFTVVLLVLLNFGVVFCNTLRSDNDGDAVNFAVSRDIVEYM